MKKFYSTIICLLGLSAIASAQCQITSATVTPSGLSVNAVMMGTGATAPGYGWDWGDASSPATTQSASHTYAAPGTYIVCAVYLDMTAPTTCIDTMCQAVIVSAVGVAETQFATGTVSTTPNPFGATTNFNVNLTKESDVEISVYDMNGKLVETVQDGTMAQGANTIAWTPTSLAEGVYFVQMSIDGQIQTRKLVHTGNQ